MKKSLLAIFLLVLGLGQVWGGTRRIYFDFSAVTMWDDDTELAGGTGYVGVHCWGSGTLSDTDYHMSATGTANLAYADIDDSYTSVCFFRAASDNTWWNQTQNRSDITTNNRFKIKDAKGEYDADIGKYLWADSGAGVRWAPGSTIDGLIDVNNPHNQAFSFSGSTGTYSVTLSAHSTYQFKILEGTTAYGLDNNVFTGPISNYESSSSGYAYRLATAGEGTYTFTWDNSTKKLSISFPSVTHPSADYCYLYDHGWGYEKQFVHVWNSASEIAQTTWPGTKVPNTTTINGSTYYICAPGDYANLQFSNGISGEGAQATSDLTASEGYGKYMYHDGSSWAWHSFTFSVTLNTNSGTIEDGHDVTSYTFGTGATLPNSDYISRTGYTFGGWYNNAEFDGSAITAISTTDNGDTTLYAKWTPIPYNISYELDGGTKFFADTQTEYNIESSTITLHAAARSGYVFAGWYSDEGLETPASTIPTGSTGDKTFYAKWTEQSCVGENSAGLVFQMRMNTNSDPSPTAINLTAGQYADLSSYTDGLTRGTAVYGTKSSNASITAGGSKERRRLEMSSSTHVLVLNLSCPLVAYDTIYIYNTHADSEGTYEFNITTTSERATTIVTSGNAVSSDKLYVTKYVVPVGSPLIGVTPIYIWGNAASQLRIQEVRIRRPNKYRLIYNGNSGEATNVPEAEYRPASAVALSSTVPVLGNYTFAGWNTASNGSGDNYASGADYTIPSVTTTLYAKWTLDVTLDDNGGTGGSTSVTMTHKSNTHSAITLPIRAGYEFTGYYNRSTGGIQVTDATGALLKGVSNSYLSSDGTWKYSSSGLTLYAHWKFVIYRTGDAPDGGIETFAGGSTIDWPIEYRMKVHTLDQWYSLYLPFTVDSIKVIEEGVYYDIQPYYRPTVGGTLYQGHYFIRTPAKTEDFEIANFSDWRDPVDYDKFKPSGNTPYIIRWHDSYFLKKYIAIFGHTSDVIPEEMTVHDRPTKDSVVNVYGNDAMVSGSVEDGYTLEPDYGSGSWLREEEIGDSRTVLPFECYLRANDKTTPIFKALRRTDTATGLPMTDDPSPSTEKMLINGQVVIIRDNKMYNVLGMEIQ